MFHIFIPILLLKFKAALLGSWCCVLMVDYNHSNYILFILYPHLFFPSYPLNWPPNPFIKFTVTLLYRRYVEVL